MKLKRILAFSLLVLMLLTSCGKTVETTSENTVGVTETEEIIMPEPRIYEEQVTLDFSIAEAIQTNGTVASDDDWRSTDYIEIPYDARYYGYNLAGCADVLSVAFYGAEKQFLLGIAGEVEDGYRDIDGAATVPEGAKYVRFANYVSEADTYATPAVSVASIDYPDMSLYQAEKQTKADTGCVKIVCIGDSLTEGDYGAAPGVGNVQARNYPTYMAAYLGCETVNMGKCGYTAQTMYGHAKQKTQREQMTDADIVVIMLGTNAGLPENQMKFYRMLIEKVQETVPEAKIVLCTPPSVTENPVYCNCGYMPNVASAVESVPTLASEYGLPVIDVFHNSPLTQENEFINQPRDGLHFRSLGYARLACYIGDSLRALYPDIFAE